jgi:hypothetical protein
VRHWACERVPPGAQLVLGVGFTPALGLALTLYPNQAGAATFPTGSRSGRQIIAPTREIISPRRPASSSFAGSAAGGRPRS